MLDLFYRRSITMAEAPPPPLQMLATPMRPFLALRTVIKVPIMRAPLHPIGCPIETAPIALLMIRCFGYSNNHLFLPPKTLILLAGMFNNLR